MTAQKDYGARRPRKNQRRSFRKVLFFAFSDCKWLNCRQFLFALLIAATLTSLSDVPVCRAISADTPRQVTNAKQGVVCILNLHEYSSGSGFAIGKAGKKSRYFLTNWHVIVNSDGSISDEIYIALDDDAQVIYYREIPGLEDAYAFERVENHYDKMVKCRVLKTTSGNPDYAILEAEREVENRVALPLMSARRMRDASRVYAIGYPGTADQINGLSTDGEFLLQRQSASADSSTLTDGTVSRRIRFSQQDNTWVIQHTAHINHGNSGGPLLNVNGAVVGINTYGIGATDYAEYNLAVFVDYAMNALDELGIAYDTYRDWSPLRWPALIASAALLAVVIAVTLKNRAKNATAPPAFVSQESDSSARRPAAPLPAVRREEDGRKSEPSADKAEERYLAPSLCLQCVSGIFASRRFAIDRDLRLGRNSKRNNLVFPSDYTTVSGIHCQLLLEGGTLYLEDMNSRNGTWYEGQRLIPGQKTPLKEGDTFRLGQRGDMFRIERSRRRLANVREGE